MNVRSMGLMTAALCVAALCLVAKAEDAAEKAGQAYLRKRDAEWKKLDDAWKKRDPQGFIRAQSLQSEYTRMAEAWKRKVLQGFMRAYAPDFKRKLPDGKIRSRAEEEAAYRNLLAHTTDTREILLKIGRAQFQGNKAEVGVTIWWSYIDGLRLLGDTDTWIKTAEGWKLKASASPGGDKFSFMNRPKRPSARPKK